MAACHAFKKKRKTAACHAQNVGGGVPCFKKTKKYMERSVHRSVGGIGFAMILLGFCGGFAMILPWFCHEFDKVL